MLEKDGLKRSQEAIQETKQPKLEEDIFELLNANMKVNL